MILFSDGYTEISTISNEDKPYVLKLYSENDFGCDAETGALRPTNEQFNKIMDDIISGKDDESNIFVVKEQGRLIGYASCFVEYDRIIIGHIAIEKDRRGIGFGSVLTNFVMFVAENEDRDVTLFCTHPNSCFKKIGLETIDGVHYIYERQNVKHPEIPSPLFVDKDEYKKRQEIKAKKEQDRFARFLESDIVKKLWEL